MSVEESWLPVILSILILLLIARVAARIRKRLLAEQMLAQVRAVNLHPLQVHSGPDAGGFVAKSRPAPEPFEQLMILFVPASHLDPFGLVRRLLGRHRQLLRVRGMLRATPTTELIWRRYGGQPGRQHVHSPGGVDAGPSPYGWVHRSLDFNQAQYSIRGKDAAALEHVFAEFHTRFGPVLQEFVVRSEHSPHVEIVLAAPRLDPVAIAGLLISLRSVGRAAGLK